MAIFGEDGVLEKGGFYMDGYIKKDGTAFIKMISGFGNRTNLINEVRSLLSLAFVLYNNALRHVDNLLRHVDNLLRHVDNVLRHLAQGITSGSAMSLRHVIQCITSFANLLLHVVQCITSYSPMCYVM